MSPVSPELPTSELARLREQFEIRRRLLEVVAKISTLFARSSDLSTALFEGLRMIGEAAHFSRCLLLQRRAPSASEEENTYTVVVEWCAPGVRSHYDCGSSTIASQDATNFIQRLRHGETFCCRIHEVAEPLRSVFERMEIRATGCAPIVVGDALWGTLAFDDCVRDDPWDDAHIGALTAVSNTISNAIQTQHRAEELAGERERVAQERAAELAKSNAALRRGAARLANSGDIDASLNSFLTEVVLASEASAGAAFLLTGHNPTELICKALIGPTGERLSADWFEEYRLASAGNVEGVLTAILNGPVTAVSLTEPFMFRDFPKLAAWHAELGHRVAWNVPLRVGERAIGFLGLAFDHETRPTDTLRETLEAMALQVALAVEITSLSERARDAALSREREVAAQERALELAKSNAALRRSISKLADVPDVEAAMVEAISTAAEVIGSSGGALGLYLPEERGFRTVFQVVDGKRIDLEGLSYHSRLYSLDEDPIRLAWEQFHSGDGVLWCSPDSCYLSEDSRRLILQQGFGSSMLLALKRGAECIGYLGFFSHRCEDLLVDQRELLRAIADQVSLMLELSRLARLSEGAAVAREREVAARERASELSKANDALQVTTDALSTAQGLENIIPTVLRIVSQVFGIETAGFYEVIGGTIYLRYWFADERVFSPPELPNIEGLGGLLSAKRLAEGFQVPDCYLGKPMPERREPVVLNHAVGTCQPEFDEWARQAGRDLELNIPVVIRQRVVAALCLYRGTNRPYLDSEIALAQALVKQFALALEAERLGVQARESALAREREKAAEERAVALARANDELALRDRLLTASARALEHLMSTRVFAEGVEGALRQIGEAAGLSRVKVLLQDHSNDSEPVHKLMYEWWVEGLQSQASLGYVSFPDSSFQNELNRLYSEKRWWGRVEDWPEAIQSAFRAIGVTSVGIVPIYVKQEYVGLVAFDQSESNRDWSEPEIDALTIAARGLGAALEQEKIVGQLAQERERAAHERAAELIRTNDELALRDRLLTASANALEQLISAQDFSAGIEETLRQIGEAAQLSRVQVLMRVQLEDGAFAHQLVHEWWTSTLEPQSTTGPTLFPDADFQDVIDRIVKGERWWARVEDWPAAVQPIFREIGIVATGVVPIFVQHEYVGHVAFDQCVPEREWSEAEIGALTIAARGIGAALSQERIMRQLVQEREAAAQERAAELVKANHALRTGVDDLVTQTTTSGILTSLLKQAVGISGASSGAILRRVEGSEFEYVTIYANGEIRSSEAILAAGTNDEMRLASRLDPTGHFAMLSRGEAHCRDATDEILGRHLPRSHAFHQGAGNQRIYDFPYKVAGTVFGYLGLAFNDHNPPSEVVQETIKALATQVGLALEFRRISEQIERAAVLEERNKFARDLHDSLAQGFAGILMQLGAAEQISSIPVELQHYLTRIDELARTSLSEARRTVNELRTSCQIRDALPKRLRDLAARLGSSYGETVQVSITGYERSLLFEVEEELFSITQESLTNALKHAEATEIRVELTFLESGVRLKVRDNGNGFSSEHRRKDGHFGLHSMQERSQRINATMTIISEKGFGTEILTLWKE